MSSFTAPLELRPVGGLWETARQFAYEIGWLGSGLTIEVEKGFLTDLGTIPFLFRWFLDPSDPKASAAFVLHDKLCLLCNEGKFSRRTADAIFHEAMLVLRVPHWKAYLMFLGVRIFALVKDA